MVKKLLNAFFLSLCASGAAMAQVQLIINAPAPIAGNIQPLGLTAVDGSWGFHRDTTGPVTAPTQCVMGVDSFACAALPAGSLSGKIAVIHRGPDPALGLGQPCGFGTKALNCQNAGAVGVLMIYEPRDGQAENALPEEVSGSNGANVDGGLVRIPVVMVDRPTGRRIKPLLCSGGNVTMGGFLGFYNNNISINAAKGCISPPAAAMPNFMIRDTGQFVFVPGIEVINTGKEAQTGAQAKAVITRFFNGNTDTVYDQTVSVPPLNAVVTVADTEYVDFPRFDMATAVAGTNRLGIYTLTYSVIGPNGDDSYMDNEVQYEFQITQDKFSLARLNFDNQDFVSRDFVSPALTGVPPTNRVYRYGVVFHTNQIDAGDALYLKSVRFGVRAGDSVDFTALNINAEVFEWGDADNNGAISDAELNQVGNGLLTFDSDTMNGKYFDVTIEDLNTGNPTIQLAADKSYLALMTYRGDDIVSWSYEDKGFSYYRYFSEQAPTVISPVFINQWYSGYSDWPVAAMRVDFDFQDNGPVLKTQATLASSVRVAPNPARNRFRIMVSNLEHAGLTYTLTDLTGKVLMTGIAAGAETTVNTSALPAGMYQVRLSGKAGTCVVKVQVQ